MVELLIKLGACVEKVRFQFVFRKSRKTEAERVQLAKDEGILMFIYLVISCDALTGAGTLHPQK